MRLTIGEVANRSGIGIETIRFYERKGLIDDPPRTVSGYRQYPEDVILKLRFIRQAKQLGFSLQDIKELLALRIEPGVTCKDIKARTTSKISEIEEKIQILLKMKKVLTTLDTSCKGRGPISSCPILAALEHEPTPDTQ